MWRNLWLLDHTKCLVPWNMMEETREVGCLKDQVLHRWACLKWHFLGGNSIRNLLLSASFYCKIYCSRDQQNPVSRPIPNLVSHSSNHYKAAEIFSENLYLISKIFGESYWHVFTMFRFAFKLPSFSFVIFCLCLQIWSSHRSPLSKPGSQPARTRTESRLQWWQNSTESWPQGTKFFWYS